MKNEPKKPGSFRNITYRNNGKLENKYKNIGETCFSQDNGSAVKTVSAILSEDCNTALVYCSGVQGNISISSSGGILRGIGTYNTTLYGCCISASYIFELTEASKGTKINYTGHTGCVVVYKIN